MKKKPWKREVRYLYKMFMKNLGRTTNLGKALGYYKIYDELCHTVLNDPDCPKAVQECFVVKGVKPPKYYIWAKQFMVEKKK